VSANQKNQVKRTVSLNVKQSRRRDMKLSACCANSLRSGKVSKEDVFRVSLPDQEISKITYKTCPVCGKEHREVVSAQGEKVYA
jgi:hypothetical protein